MPKYTEQQIRDAAEGACFYVTAAGQWLRMQWCDMDSGSFCATDEDSGEDYEYEFADLVNEDPEFHHLTRTIIG